jgi:hypothetical protein
MPALRALAPPPQPRPRALSRVVGTAAGVVLGVVLLVAAATKALDPNAFVEQIRLEGLDRWLPATAVAFTALALEAGLGLALVLGIRRLPVLLASAALVAFFLFLTGRAYWLHLQGDLDPALAACGCFGNLVERTPAQAFWQDVLMLVPALLLAFLGRPEGRWPGRRLAVVAAATAAFLAFAWRAPSLPLDDLATRLRPGVEIAKLCAGAAASGQRVCLDAVVPDLAEERHLVAIVDLDAPQPERWVAPLNALTEAAAAGGGARVWALHGSDAERQRLFFWEHAPAFELREAPASLLRPLYRRLPRAFEVAAGRVVKTWAELPPPAALAGAPGAESPARR